MLAECYKEFLDYLIEVQGCDHKTIAAYQKNLIDFNNHLFEGSLNTTFEQIGKLKVSEIQTKWLNVLRDEDKYLSNTLNQRIATLKRLYTYMIGEGYTEVNKAKLIPSYKGNSREKVQLDTEVYVSLLQELRNKRDNSYQDLRNWFMVELFLATGLRRAELVYLDISDISFATGKISIVRKYEEGVKFGKQRTEYLPDVLIDDLNYYMEGRNDFPSIDDALFVSDRKKRISTRRVNEIMNKIAEEYGLERLHPHVLRRGFTSNTINSGEVQSHEVAEVIGHSNKATTLNEYHRADKSVLKRVANSNMIFKDLT